MRFTAPKEGGKDVIDECWDSKLVHVLLISVETQSLSILRQ